ncbi:MAG: hypothetical protein XD50_1651 [Clostridia bacterium 41_269]|nr:MAG: hypothetical protein XD50_1651 [Clostridia bacterium 41_269]
MITANYEYIPGIQKASFKLPFKINLEKLERFFKKKNMETKIKNEILTAQTTDTYIYVSRNGYVQIHSFKKNTPPLSV